MTITESTTAEIDVHVALGRLAAAAVAELGSGRVNEEGETNGQLDGLVDVRFTSVLGGDRAVTLDEDNVITVWLDEDRAAIQQLRALLEALEEHCISPYKLLR